VGGGAVKFPAPWQEQVQEKQGVDPGTGSVWVTVVVKLLLVLEGGRKEV